MKENTNSGDNFVIQMMFEIPNILLQTKTTAENKIHTIYYIHAKSATLVN